MFSTALATLRSNIGTLDVREENMAKVSHMVLLVSDLQKSRDWYVNKLGFKLEREREQAVGIKDESGLTIFLQQTAGSLAGQKITLTIQVDNVDTRYQELVTLGVKFVSPPKRQFWGYGAEVLDPDGYVNHLWDEVSMRKAMSEK
jgi:catechol 2,3-dioxygenase-like lactoylglutathione lyase family enzyme